MNILSNILRVGIGLVGLGFVIFIHELGHLIAAKAVGIEVEAFSIGWGKRLWGFNWRGTDYRISIFPIGGFCKMKGEQSYARALDENSDEIPAEPGSFFAAPPWKRIVAMFAGPAANILLAIILLAAVWFFGFNTETYSNRIILASDYDPVPAGTINPADAAGLETGDAIVSIDGRPIRGYSDLQQAIGLSALRELPATVLRNGVELNLVIEPALETESGAGYLGVYPWVDPVVDYVLPESPAEEAGMLAGDIVVAAEGQPIRNSMELGSVLESSDFPVNLRVNRAGREIDLTVPGVEAEGQGIVLGVAFETVTIRSQSAGPISALGRGAAEAFTSLADSVRSLKLLFQGVRVTSALAGPARITFLLGDIAAQSFAAGFGVGVVTAARFLALISVVLFFMNLLPIPVLDGGQIILATVEWIRGRSPKPRVLYRVQLVGTVVIFGILFVALFGDILFFATR
jgi:regulator of sigma E protease